MKHTKLSKIIITILALTLLALPMLGALTACDKRETVIIYTSAEDYRIEYMQQCLDEQFPEYRIVISYMSTGNHAAKLIKEGKNTECDISYDLEYPYLEQLDKNGFLADLSSYDKSIYAEDVRWSENYIIEYRNGGAIILNTEVMNRKGLAEPTCYADLLKPEYKGLISMPGPKSSGTGYMFLKSLVNAWGEEKAFKYFDDLAENIKYTESGSGPVNALKLETAAIGLGMTGQAVTAMNDEENPAPLKIIYFEEGSPFTLYGQAIIAGKEQRECVKRVFDYLINTYNELNNKLFFPEKIFANKDFTTEMANFPQNIKYSDMTGSTYEAKQDLLAKWKY